jgi:hypothetical protein
VGGHHPKTAGTIEEADQSVRGRRPLSRVGVPDRLAAVERPGEVELGGEGGQPRQLVPVEGESLRVGVELPDATKPEPGAAAQLLGGGRVGGLDDAAAGDPAEVPALQGGHPVVGLGAEPGIGERPGEDHGTIDPLLVEVTEQVVLARQPLLPRVTGGEPGIGGGDRGRVAPHPVRHDVDVGVHDLGMHERGAHDRGLLMRPRARRRR